MLNFKVLLSTGWHCSKLYSNSWFSPNTNTRRVLLQQLIVLLIQANSVFSPELLRFVHWTPLQTARLQLRAVLIKRTARGRRKAVEMWEVKNVENMLREYVGFTWDPERSLPVFPGGTWCHQWCPHHHISAGPGSPAVWALCTGSWQEHTPDGSLSQRTSPAGSTSMTKHETF